MGWLSKIVEGLAALAGILNVFRRKKRTECEHAWERMDGSNYEICSKCMKLRRPLPPPTPDK